MRARLQYTTMISSSRVPFSFFRRSREGGSLSTWSQRAKSRGRRYNPPPHTPPPSVTSQARRARAHAVSFMIQQPLAISLSLFHTHSHHHPTHASILLFLIKKTETTRTARDQLHPPLLSPKTEKRFKTQGEKRATNTLPSTPCSAAQQRLCKSRPRTLPATRTDAPASSSSSSSRSPNSSSSRSSRSRPRRMTATRLS